MYNSEVKARFINEFSTKESRKNAAVTTFNALESYEERWGADVCTKSTDELLPVLSEVIGARTSSKNLGLPILKAYAHWCMDNGIPGACDGLLQIEELGLEKLKRQMVASPQHLQRYLDCICDKETENTVDCTYRCFYWLAYSGMDAADTLKVVTTEVDLAGMVVKHNGQEYPIYQEAIPAFQNCVESTQFKYKHPNYTREVFKDRILGDTLLRGFPKSRSLTSMKVEMSRRSRNPRYRPLGEAGEGDLDLQLSFYRVQLSGLFYRTYEAERAGKTVDFMDAAGRFMEGKTYKLDKGRNLPGAKQRQLAGDYLEDYNRWKKAYNLI